MHPAVFFSFATEKNCITHRNTGRERGWPVVIDWEKEKSRQFRAVNPLHTATPNHSSVQGSINSDVMPVGEVGGDGSAGHPWVFTSSQVSFLCWRRRNVFECVHEGVRACMCEREAPGYHDPSAHVGGFALPDALGHFGSHKRTHTQSTHCFLYGNQSCQLPDRLTLQYDWLICGDVGVSQSWLRPHWWCRSNERVSHRHVREKRGWGGSERETTGTVRFFIFHQ